jgi:endonuclease/exonuclease/phosphatase family metal-dependent hydrolase
LTARRSWLDRAPFTAVGLLWPGRALEQAPGPTGDGAGFRLVTANALRTNRRPRRWADALVGLRPDVLCVQELTDRVDAALAAAGVNDLLPHRCGRAGELSEGTGLWSRWPLDGSEVLDAGHALAVARVGAIGATVASFHAVAPSSRRKGPRWLASLHAVAALAERTSGPLVVGGDWNATLAHGPLRDLLGGGRLRDAHVDAGRRFARTWPARLPVALLDRVAVSPEVAVRAIVEHRLPGSDHRAVLAELAVVDPARTA